MTNDTLLLLLLLLAPLQYCHGQRQQQHVQYAEVPLKNKLPPLHRQLQLNLNSTSGVSNFTESCSLCSGFPVFETKVAPYYGFDLDGLHPPNATCGELSTLFGIYIPASTPNASFGVSPCIQLQEVYASICCQRPSPQYTCEQNIRSSLLENYDSSIVPIDDDGVLQIYLLIDLLHISQLSTKDGTVNVFVWFHLSWRDPRLAWTISGENCTTSITARASTDFERTELFVPDVDLLNQVEGGTQAFPDALATVYHDGTVVWRRNGGLKAFCFFTGLLRFPFDTLGCSFIVGPWVRDHAVELTLGGPNHTGWMAGESLDEVIYNEYTLVVEQTQSGYYALPLKSYAYFNLYFERSSRYYVLKVLLPTIVFTILSFGVFFLDLRVGERLTYGLTVLLVIIAQDISTSALLPITDKRLWINTFVIGSFYWVLITNLESVFVAYLYFLGDENHFEYKHRGRKKEAGEDEDEVAASGIPVEESSQRNEDESGDPPSLSEHKAVSFMHHDVNMNDKENAAADETDATRTNRRAGFARAATSRLKLSSRRILTFRQLLMQSNQPTIQRHRTILKIDSWCFWILFITYVLFVVLMFATNSVWSDDNDLYTEEDGEAPKP